MYSVAGIYISWPFCAQKCTYCNFASGVFPRELEFRYIDALLKEISAHQFAWAPETFYIGGGTPSGMELEAIEKLKEAGAIPIGLIIAFDRAERRSQMAEDDG